MHVSEIEPRFDNLGRGGDLDRIALVGFRGEVFSKEWTGHQYGAHDT